MIDTAEEDDDDNALKPVQVSAGPGAGAGWQHVAIVPSQAQLRRSFISQGKSLKALIKETRAVDPMNVAKSDERASKNRAFVAGLKGAGGGCAGINWWRWARAGDAICAPHVPISRSPTRKPATVVPSPLQWGHGRPLAGGRL